MISKTIIGKLGVSKKICAYIMGFERICILCTKVIVIVDAIWLVSVMGDKKYNYLKMYALQ